MCPKTASQPFHILFADDGSDHAKAAVQLLNDLRLPPGSRITVLRVFSPLQAAENPLIRESLEATCALVDRSGLKVEAEMVLGYPAEKIIEFTEKIHPSLIVIGAKGLRSTLGILLGGVAQHVVEYACCPVLVVREPYAGLKRVLYATDGSTSSRYALEYITWFPFPDGHELEIIHVLPPPPYPVVLLEPTFPVIVEPVKLTDAELARRQEEEALGQKLLDETAAGLAQAGKNTQCILRRGDAATEIIDYVKAQKVDLIVTGSRGLSQMRAWLLGSVSRKLVHYSGCSILVVRAPRLAE